MFRMKILRLLTIISMLSIMNMQAEAVVPKVDFNGDGMADIFFKEAYSGAAYGWLVDETYVFKQVSFGQVSPNEGWVLMGLDDFNGDHLTDFLYYNSYTKSVVAVLANENGFFDETFYGQVNDDEWVPMALEDFNGDGIKDFLWYNLISNDLHVWILGESGILYERAYGTAPSNKDGWIIAGFKDFNGDRSTDILWNNRNTGEYVAWMLNGDGVMKNTLYGAIPPELMWVLIGLEDFNDDGSTDMLLYHVNSGLLVGVMLDGDSVIQVSSYGLTLPALEGWSMLGLNDFNGDGRADLLWNNAYTGEIKSWILNGDGVIRDVSYGDVVVNSGWSLLGADDYNGDGRSDLLWYNYFNNATEAWLVSNSGAKRVSYEDVPRSEAWLIQVPPR